MELGRSNTGIKNKEKCYLLKDGTLIWCLRVLYYSQTWNHCLLNNTWFTFKIKIPGLCHRNVRLIFHRIFNMGHGCAWGLISKDLSHVGFQGRHITHWGFVATSPFWRSKLWTFQFEYLSSHWSANKQSAFSLEGKWKPWGLLSLHHGFQNS